MLQLLQLKSWGEAAAIFADDHASKMLSSEQRIRLEFLTAGDAKALDAPLVELNAERLKHLRAAGAPPAYTKQELLELNAEISSMNAALRGK